LPRRARALYFFAPSFDPLARKSRRVPIIAGRLASGKDRRFCRDRELILGRNQFGGRIVPVQRHVERLLTRGHGAGFALQ
jgi:hypothetical protein